jgi:hypothetical protein
VADKKKLNKAVVDRRYRATPKGMENQRRCNASEAGKQSKRRYAARYVGKKLSSSPIPVSS